MRRTSFALTALAALAGVMAVAAPAPASKTSNPEVLTFDWPKSFPYPHWVVDSAPVYLEFRGNGAAGEKTEVSIAITDYDRREVGKLGRTITLGSTGIIELPIPRAFGPYLIRGKARLTDGKTMEFQKVVSRISAPAAIYCDNLGSHGNFPLLPWLGAGWNRMWDTGQRWLLWHYAKPEKDGPFVWNENLAPAPLKTLAVLDGCPKWAKGPQENIVDWLDYARSAARQGQGKIAMYEIFNEPYSSAGQYGFEKYAEIVAKTAAAIREGDPKAVVATGGPPQEIPPGLDWWYNALSAGVFNSVDAITAHLYFGGGGTYPIDQDMCFDSYVTALRRMLNAKGQQGKKLIDSESGLCPMESFYITTKIAYGTWGGRGFSPRKPVPYRVGTAMMARFLIFHFLHDIRWTIYHAISAYGNAWSLVDIDGTPLPATVAIAQLTRILNEAKPIARIMSPENVSGARFEKNGKAIAAFWAINLRRGETRSFAAPSGDGVKLMDMFANELPDSPRHDLGISPVLAIGDDDAVSRFLRELSVESTLNVAEIESSQYFHSDLTLGEGGLLPRVTASNPALLPRTMEKENRAANDKAAVIEKTTTADSSESVLYEWNAPQIINWITVSWQPGNTPRQYKVEWFDGLNWRNCEGTPDWRAPNAPLESFPVRELSTDRLRVLIRPKADIAAKLIEFSAFSVPRLTSPLMEPQEVYNQNFLPSKPDGYIGDWLLCGPFPSPGLRNRYGSDSPTGWHTDFLSRHYHYAATKDANAIPVADQEHFVRFPEPKDTEAEWPRGIARVAWYPYHAPPGTWGVAFEFPVTLSGNGHIRRMFEQSFGYATCVISLGEDFNGLLSIGSDDGYKIWIDGKIFAEKIVFRGVAPDQEKYSLSLKKGDHRILLKVHNDIGGHGFYLRLVRSDGTPFRAFTTRVVP